MYTTSEITRSHSRLIKEQCVQNKSLALYIDYELKIQFVIITIKPCE